MKTMTTFRSVKIARSTRTVEEQLDIQPLHIANTRYNTI